MSIEVIGEVMALTIAREGGSIVVGVKENFRFGSTMFMGGSFNGRTPTIILHGLLHNF